MTSLLAVYFQGAGGSMGLIMMVGIFAVFYFLLILPQQRKQKKWQAMLGSVKAGDRVATNGGIRGVIMSVKSEGPDPTVILRIPPDNLRIEISRSAIVSVFTDEVAPTK
ncbi:MAG: preprotein translocase subunit YajC [Candidatus Korobacteraceae bacterium]|jgi:preprotein translocase subunit YajC